jgi:hypothetical protein
MFLYIERACFTCCNCPTLSRNSSLKTTILNVVQFIDSTPTNFCTTSEHFPTPRREICTPSEVINLNGIRLNDSSIEIRILNYIRPSIFFWGKAPYPQPVPTRDYDPDTCCRCLCSPPNFGTTCLPPPKAKSENPFMVNYTSSKLSQICRFNVSNILP